METSSPAKHTYNTWYAAKNHNHNYHDIQEELVILDR